MSLANALNDLQQVQSNFWQRLGVAYLFHLFVAAGISRHLSPLVRIKYSTYILSLFLPLQLIRSIAPGASQTLDVINTLIIVIGSTGYADVIHRALTGVWPNEPLPGVMSRV